MTHQKILDPGKVSLVEMQLKVVSTGCELLFNNPNFVRSRPLSSYGTEIVSPRPSQKFLLLKSTDS